MTAAVISSLPFQAGGAVASAAGRTLLWAATRYLRRPLRNTAIAGLVGLSALAGSNALYFQAHRHPAPLFGTPNAPQIATQPMPAQIVPATRPKSLTLPLVTDAPAANPPAPVLGTAEVMEIQQKLKAFGLFDATVDGLFGPRTSHAIKAFEEKLGRAQKGELTAEVLALIRSTPMPAVAAAPEPLPTPDPLPNAAPVVTPAPLPAPEPLVNTIQPMQPVAEAAAPLTRDLPDTPEEAVAIAAGVAQDAVDTVVDKVEALGLTSTGSVPKRVVQTVAIIPPSAGAALDAATASTDPEIVAKVQRGLASLGFLHGTIDGVAGEATSKAIRNFETYYDYAVTGRIGPDLVNLLVQNGAVI